jgi:hypothetical protein
MKQTDIDRFGNAFGYLCEVFEKQSSPIVTKAYFRSLEGFEIRRVEQAIWESISKFKFFPKPVEIITLITGGEPKVEDTAMAQVNEIMRQVRELGSYRTPAFSDPITADLMASRWSWKSVCSMTETEHKWFAKEFVDAYRAANQGGRKNQLAIEGCPTNRLRLLAGGIGK